MHSIIIGTAGHIDHGKSALVQALTGKIPTVYLKRNDVASLSILVLPTLIWATCAWASSMCPATKRFVKNMLAGVHGIDAVALVIAADEGVMPQTREHFDICRLLRSATGFRSFLPK